MKVIHVPFSYFPDPPGGTEVYVEALSRYLEVREVTSVVAAPGAHDAVGEHNGVTVHRFAGTAEPDLRSLYGFGDPVAARRFERILDAEVPDVVHLHSFTNMSSVRLLHATRERGLPVVFTYHLPTVSCQRGTLMAWGRDVCDGSLRTDRCTRCTLHSEGLPRVATGLVGRVPVRVGRALGEMGLSGGPWTALRMRDLVTLRHASVLSFLAGVDRIVVPCRWAEGLLVRNGVMPRKISYVPHRLPYSPPPPETAPQARRHGQEVRIAYAGRLGHAKGTDILVRAVTRMQHAGLALDMYCVPQGDADLRELNALRALARRDPRIRFKAPVPAARLPEVLRRYDALAVPSRWLETGPLVVLDAFAAGTPVLGMGRGGIAELVRDGADGLLVGSDSVEAWCSALARLTDDPTLIATLKAGVRSPATMDVTAQEMVDVYRESVAQDGARGAPAQTLERHA